MPAAPVRRLPEPSSPARGESMTLLAHVEEFRVRLIRVALAVGGGMVASFFFVDEIFAFVFAPTRRMLPPGAALIYTQPGEAFALYINIALISGAIAASPFIFFQIWGFIAPALYAREKRFAIPFVLLTTIGALGGAAFSHYVLFPYMIGFFGTFSTAELAFMPRVSDVFGLYIKMLGACALIFQMPTFAFFLARMSLITAGWLWRNIKYAILVIFIVSAVITPSADPYNQIIFAAPMIVLYFISIAVAMVARPRTREDAAA